ncbi:MAG: branched-chain amino acid ABC transporter permease [Promethearchaeota archaeon]|jgi:branched-chain amino acid transport system permease protein
MSKLKEELSQKTSAFPSYFKSWVKTFSGGLTLLCLIILIIIPLIAQERRTFIRTLSLALIFCIFAASWDFLTGIAGQISFGHAIFFGIAGYLCAYFIKYQNWVANFIFLFVAMFFCLLIIFKKKRLYILVFFLLGGDLLFVAFMFVVYLLSPILLAIITGAVGAVFFGLIIGIPSLRLKGPYLALGTLAFNLILLKLFLMGSLANIFFGSEGIPAVPKLSNEPTVEFYILLISMIISFIVLIQLAKSKFGTVLKAIRDDETGADASGINTTNYKIYAFMISAFFAGLAGAFYALYIGAVNPTGNYGQLNSFLVIIMASLGGLATISGSAVGAFFFIILEFTLIEAGLLNWVQLLFAIILIIVVRFTERGILQPALEKIKDLWDILLGK